RAQGEYYQPDHWTEYTFPKGTAQEPIRGVRAEDAKAFCEWLTQRQGGDIVRYRLPKHIEIMDYSPITVRNNLATWCRTNDGYSLNGLTTEYKSSISLWATGVSKLPFDLNVSHLNVLDLDSAFESTRALVFAREFTNEFANGIVEAFKSARDFVRAHNLAGNYLVCDLARVDARNLNSLYDAIKKPERFQAAEKIVQDMQAGSNVVLSRLKTLLHDMRFVATATPVEARQAWRQYIAIVAESIWIGYDKLEKLERPGWKRWLFRRSQSDYCKDKQAILNLYWWLQIVMAREDGKLPAWEGIRIVRERERL
ncbi:MAG: hypothetical protein DRR19_30565, partial [Candidatus Parabeggiatoa sp. nov. 1]